MTNLIPGLTVPGEFRVFNIENYGGRGDYDGDPTTATDNHEPFQAALRDMDRFINPHVTIRRAGAILYFPPGAYYFSRTININRSVHILGAAIGITTFHV